MYFKISNLNTINLKDGKRNWCSVGDSVYMGTIVDKYVIADTSHSKKCIVVLDNIIIEKTNQLRSESVKMNYSKEILDYLKSLLNNKSCSSKALDDLDETSEIKNGLKEKASSDATTLTKMSSSLLLTQLISKYHLNS